MVVLIDTSVADDPAKQICDEYGCRPDALLEILHEAQRSFGYLSDGTLRVIADALNISRAEIHGVVSFYHDYRRDPPARLMIKICRAEACQAVGSDELTSYAEKKVGASLGEKAADGSVGLDAVYCLGNCALGPAVLVNQELHGRVTAERFDALVAEKLAEKGSLS